MMPSAEYVQYHKENTIGYITLNRPEKRNALNIEVWEQLNLAIEQAEKDPTSRVIILKGEGKSFCSGLDLSPENNFLTKDVEASADQKVAFYQQVKRLQEIHTRLERISKPSIAIIQGHCIGAGLELALCCDIRVCEADSIFAMPEARLAVITDVGGLQRLTKVVGRGHAREICFRGHLFDADYAKSIRLVNTVYPDSSQLMAEAVAIAEEIAANPPLSVQGMKDVFVFSEDTTLSHSLAYNAARSSMIIPSSDLYEATATFSRKRNGSFNGC